MTIIVLMSLDLPQPDESADDTDAGGGRVAPVRLREARRRAKISQIVAAEIVRYVVEERLQEGDRLPTEAEMLNQFGVGRGSLREALRLLEAYGLISIRQGQNGGPVLATLRAEDVARTLSFYFHLTGATYAELIEARMIIEPVMARLAAERQHPEHMAQLRATTEREQAASLDDPEYLACADEFHYMVSGMSGNRVLDLLGRALRTMFQERVRHGSLLPTESRQQNRKVHRQIADAIQAGNGGRAERLMARHLGDLAGELDDQLPHYSGDRITWEG
jgi:GntR family transcriptional regulator, transcriptional repressor for pyruvate dehydrogenase complex